MPTWLHTPGCLALVEWSHHHGYLGHEDLFCSSSVYSCHVFLISSASVRSIQFLSFIVPIFAWNVPLVALAFLKRSIVFKKTKVGQRLTEFCQENALVIANTLFQQHKTLHMDFTRCSIPKSDWLYSLQSKMELIHIVSKNKTWSWLWLKLWAPYCKIQA